MRILVENDFGGRLGWRWMRGDVGKFEDVSLVHSFLHCSHVRTLPMINNKLGYFAASAPNASIRGPSVPAPNVHVPYFPAPCATICSFILFRCGPVPTLAVVYYCFGHFPLCMKYVRERIKNLCDIDNLRSLVVLRCTVTCRVVSRYIVSIYRFQSNGTSLFSCWESPSLNITESVHWRSHL